MEDAELGDSAVGSARVTHFQFWSKTMSCTSKVLERITAFSILLPEESGTLSGVFLQETPPRTTPPWQDLNRKRSSVRRSARALCATFFAAAVVLSLSSRLVASPAPASHDYFVYVGTYTNGDSKGIYLYRFDEKTG